MANYNKVILVGNLTRDPQLSYLPSQTPVCEFGLAVSRRWKGTNGEPREETCFIDCRLYGRQAETFNQYMAKGRPVLIEGRLQYDTWEGQDGTRRSKHRINVQGFQFLDSSRGAAPQQQQQQPTAAPRAPEARGPEGGHDDFDAPPAPPDDEIPF